MGGLPQGQLKMSHASTHRKQKKGSQERLLIYDFLERERKKEQAGKEREQRHIGRKNKNRNLHRVKRKEPAKNLHAKTDGAILSRRIIHHEHAIPDRRIPSCHFGAVPAVISTERSYTLGDIRRASCKRLPRQHDVSLASLGLYTALKR